MIGVSRRRRTGPDRFLYAKVALFFLGAGFFFGGVVTGRDWAVLVAAGVLTAALALRLLGSRGGSAGAEEGTDEE